MRFNIRLPIDFIGQWGLPAWRPPRWRPE